MRNPHNATQRRVKRPTADMSPGKAEERIRAHPAKEFDADAVMAGARSAAVGWGLDILFHLSGMPLTAVKKHAEG